MCFVEPHELRSMTDVSFFVLVQRGTFISWQLLTMHPHSFASKEIDLVHFVRIDSIEFSGKWDFLRE